MSERARVGSIDALGKLRSAIVVFGEEVDLALMSADADIARLERLVQQDWPRYWKRQLQRREEAVVQAKIALEQAILSRELDDSGKSTVEERQNLARAREAVDHARARIEANKRWRRQLERERLAYRGRVQPLAQFARVGTAKASASLRQMIDRLEEYVALGVVPADGLGVGAGESGPSVGGSAREPAGRGAGAASAASDLELLVSRLPSEAEVVAAGAGDGDVAPALELSVGDRRGLGVLASGSAADAREDVIVADTSLSSGRLGLHRAASVVEGDSGWRVVGMDSAGPGGWARASMLRVIRSSASFYDALDWAPDGR